MLPHYPDVTRFARALAREPASAARLPVKAPAGRVTSNDRS